MSIISGYRGIKTKVKTAKGRKKSSTTWLSRQLNDPYVIKSKLEGYRSRAAYKLLQIDEKFNLFSTNDIVVDLGAAPGGWSQVAATLIGSDKSDSKGKVIGIDLLPIDGIGGVEFITQDFYEDSAKDRIIDTLSGQLADVVISDMAANATGHSQTDHLRIIDLCENALIFALEILKPGGHFIAKVFKGGTENQLLAFIKQNFETVKHFKPDASRKNSGEFYLVALNRKKL